MKKKIFALLMAFALCVTPMLLAAPAFAAAGPDDPDVPGSSGYSVRFIFDDGRDPLDCKVLVDTSISVSVSSSGFSLVYTDYSTSSEVNETVTVTGLDYLFDDWTQTAYYPGDSFSVSSSQDIRVVSSEESLPETGEPLFFSAFSMFQKFIFGPDTVLDEHMQLTLTILSTICVLFVVCIPFVVVWLVIRFVVG